jgi:hypothetical protein
MAARYHRGRSQSVDRHADLIRPSRWSVWIGGTRRCHHVQNDILYPGRVKATGLRNPDFVAWAKSFGVRAWRIEDAGQVSLQDLATRRALLSRLVRLLEQQLSNAAELETTRTRTAEIVREAQAWTRFAEPQPYSILLTDRLREELQNERLKLSSGETAAATSLFSTATLSSGVRIRSF